MALTSTFNPTPTYSFPIVVDRSKSRTIFSATAIPYGDAEWMCFDLKCGGSADIALHAKMRFHLYDGEKSIMVLDSFLNGAWVSQEKLPTFPFKPYGLFLLEVFAGDNGFEVSVNRERMGEFKYRDDAKKIDRLEVTGHLRLTSVEYLKR